MQLSGDKQMLNLMRMLVAAGVFFIGAAGATSAFAAECSVEQRIDLAKAGYDKAEIEALCAAGPENQAEAPPSLDTFSVLTSATYDAATKGAAKRYFGPEKKCQFLESSVKLNDGKTPREFSYDAFSSLSEKGHRFYSKLRNGIVTAHIAITANGDDDETCYAMLVRRRDVDADRFDAFVEEKRREYEAVIAALRTRGVDIDD
jgi:hypothetical protein